VAAASHDPTTTAAWSALGAHRDAQTPDLRGWFAADPGRAERLTLDVADLHVDLSKNLVTARPAPGATRRPAVAPRA
jgi:glucose-6-phosphate isomerase